jgi:hypothetical protein
MRWVSISEGDTLALSIRKSPPPKKKPRGKKKEVVFLFLFLTSLFSSTETNSLGC